MKKSILSIGKVLSKAEQKKVVGGEGGLPALIGNQCSQNSDCEPWVNAHLLIMFECSNGYCIYH